MNRRRSIAIVGGGAAGCFAAANIKALSPDTDVTIFEAGRKLLAKVAVTGGGRCNLTNTFRDIRNLEEAYPRGHRLMRRLFGRFNHEDTCKWFRDRGVRLVVQEDQCIFPESQDAMEIVSCLTEAILSSGVRVETGARVTGIEPGWRIMTGNGDCGRTFDAVIVTTGGCTGSGWDGIFSGLGLEISAPVPSLFSVRVDDKDLKSLMGTVVEKVSVSIPRTKFRASGPLLITDWGMSGPAILKLSSYAARFLAENEYRSSMIINWSGDSSVQETAEMLGRISAANPRKQIVNAFPESFNSRLWEFLLSRTGINPDTRWQDAGARALNRIAERLHADEYFISGKNRFKAEFVTCGGVSLSEISPETLECRKHPGLYFAGEVADVDAITGGFNLQAAWTMGYIAACSAVNGD